MEIFLERSIVRHKKCVKLKRVPKGNASEAVKNWESRSSGDISKVLESRPLTGIGHRALQVNEKDSSFLPSVVADEKVPP